MLPRYKSDSPPNQLAESVSVPHFLSLTRTADRDLERLMGRENPSGNEKLAQLYFVAASTVLVAVDDIGPDGQQGRRTSVTIDSDKATALFHQKNRLYEGRIRPVTVHDHPFQRGYEDLSPGDIGTLQALLRDPDQAVVDPDRRWVPIILYTGVRAARRRRCFLVLQDGIVHPLSERVIEDDSEEVSAALAKAPVLLDEPLPFESLLRDLEAHLRPDFEVELLRSKKTGGFALRFLETRSGAEVCSLPLGPPSHAGAGDSPSITASASLQRLALLLGRAFADDQQRRG